MDKTHGLKGGQNTTAAPAREEAPGGCHSIFQGSEKAMSFVSLCKVVHLRVSAGACHSEVTSFVVYPIEF